MSYDNRRYALVNRWDSSHLKKIDRLLRTLTQREEQLLRIRYGFYDGVARTLAQTGEHFGLTRERVRQIEARALDKLRRAIEMQDLGIVGDPLVN